MKTLTVTIFLLACFALTSCSQNTTKTLNNCVEQFHEKVCCNEKTTANLTVIKSQYEFEHWQDYTAIKGAIGLIDFNTYDLIVVMPNDLAMTYEFTGTPTTTGTEWSIYKYFVINCTQDSTNISLDCSPTAGYGGAFYWKRVPKLNKNKINCGCKTA